MAFQRGDVVLIPFPYTDLSASKTRPAVVVSSELYHRTRPDLLLAYVSSQLSQSHPVLDHVLVDWSSAGLPRPSFVRAKLATADPSLVVHRVGSLSKRDQFEVDMRLRQALALTEKTLAEIVAETDLSKQSTQVIQILAEQSITVLVSLADDSPSHVSLERLRKILGGPSGTPA